MWSQGALCLASRYKFKTGGQEDALEGEVSAAVEHPQAPPAGAPIPHPPRPRRRVPMATGGQGRRARAQRVRPQRPRPRGGEARAAGARQPVAGNLGRGGRGPRDPAPGPQTRPETAARCSAGNPPRPPRLRLAPRPSFHRPDVLKRGGEPQQDGCPSGVSLNPARVAAGGGGRCWGARRVEGARAAGTVLAHPQQFPPRLEGLGSCWAAPGKSPGFSVPQFP